MEDKKSQVNYIIPNFFTAASAFVGMLSIFESIRGHYYLAIIFIFLSLILDGLDGRTARLLNVTSKFGVEFDSLADLIAFGAAPAVLFYMKIGQSYGALGAAIAALFVVFGAVRLARFNVTTGTYDPSVFIGLPIPTAAVFVSLWVGFFHKFSALSFLDFFVLLIVMLGAVLMVSNIRYPSFKKLDIKKAYQIKILVILVLVAALIYIMPILFLTFVVSSYVAYGIIRFVKNFLLEKGKKASIKSEVKEEIKAKEEALKAEVKKEEKILKEEAKKEAEAAKEILKEVKEEVKKDSEAYINDVKEIKKEEGNSFHYQEEVK